MMDLLMASYFIRFSLISLQQYKNETKYTIVSKIEPAHYWISVPQNKDSCVKQNFFLIMQILMEMQILLLQGRIINKLVNMLISIGLELVQILKLPSPMDIFLVRFLARFLYLNSDRISKI
ncbi:hypothetical protein pb186bvf_014840 [Paramecium bursaria]